MLLFLAFYSMPVRAFSQNELPENSYTYLYREHNPSLVYKYDTIKQTHNYSGNWDLDGDGKADQVLFAGTGGAHLYFCLTIVLSSDHKTRHMPFIQSDHPVLPPDTLLKKPNYFPEKDKTNFCVFRNRDNKTCLFVSLDEATFSAGKQHLKKRGINTRYVVVYVQKGQTVLTDLNAPN